MELVDRTRVLSPRRLLPAIRRAIACVAVIGGLVWTAQPAAAQYIQQGSKLIGSGASGAAEQGYAVSLSDDGNTLVIGGPFDNTVTGAVWIFTRSGGAWSQQGSKFAGTGAAGPANQGWSVALSADGNTLLVGGPEDNANTGAAWVFTQSGGVWTQQGSKLVGAGAVGPAYQGTSVALSGDGSIALVGGPNDNDGAGAAWVFTRSGGVWTQQGSKLVGSNASAPAGQGTALALSGDGSTLIIGGGDAWVFTQSGGLWTQQAELSNCRAQAVALSQNGNLALVSDAGAGGLGGACTFTRTGSVWTTQTRLGYQSPFFVGASVSLSADGNTAILGGRESALVFVQNLGVWAQQGSSLIGSGEAGGGLFGWSVALSADGKTAVVGGPEDNSQTGAVWPFASHAIPAHDFNEDGNSDILWEDTSGNVAMWLMNGGSVLQSAGLGNVPFNLSITGQHDFNGDFKADVLWRDNIGTLSMWFMNGTSVASTATISKVATNWAIYGTGDLNGDSIGDLLWRDSVSGAVAVWFMNGARVTSTASYGEVSSQWTIVGDDDKGNIFWRDTAGDVAIWQVSGSTLVTRVSLGNVPTNFVIQGLGDFNGDGHTDILWRETNSGALSIWFLNGTQVTSGAAVGILASNWNVAQIGDYNGDGMSDILFLDTNGDVAMWLMNGATVSSSVGIGNVGTTWQVQNVNAN